MRTNGLIGSGTNITKPKLGLKTHRPLLYKNNPDHL